MTIAVRDESYRTHTWGPPEVSQLVYLGIFQGYMRSGRSRDITVINQWGNIKTVILAPRMI